MLYLDLYCKDIPRTEVKEMQESITITKLNSFITLLFMLLNHGHENTELGSSTIKTNQNIYLKDNSSEVT